jgi:toxin FitB
MMRMADAMIAASAAAHDLVVVTRNVKHFSPFGVAVLAPDQAPASSQPGRPPI